MRKLHIDELNRVSVDLFQAQANQNLVLVLDNVRSLNNVGSVFRTADAFGVSKLYLAGITGTPPHRDIQKTALGATESVVWEHAPDIAQLLARLKEQGFLLIAVEQTDESEFLNNFKTQATQKYALIFGNEAFGVSDEAIAVCDSSLEIPQFGSKHSFNVAVSVGIVLWHLTISS